jgi:FKBP-type peptidyl-prolyl cis-trans isomerase
MKSRFSTTSRHLLLLAALGTMGALTTACSTKTEDHTTVDYTAADQALIKKYIADNKLTNAQRLPSGLYYVRTSADTTGAKAAAGQTASVLYTGKLLDGTVFDASSKHGNTPFDFPLGRGQVIPGWDIGVALMHKGEEGVLLIPSALGYGPDGAGSDIPPNAVLRFDVKLVDVK